MITVKNIYDFLNSEAPFSNQMDWDNSGMLVGSFDKPVSKIAVMLDVTNENINKAAKRDVDLIVSHHPVIFRAIKAIDDDSEVHNLIINDISVISTHTPWDIAEHGVNAVLASALNLVDVKPLWTEEGGNMIKAGRLTQTMSEGAFCNLIKERLDIPFVKFIRTGKVIETVAVCGGAGGSMINEIPDSIDAFVTGEVSYHEFLVAKEKGLTAIEAGHFNTENLSMDYLASLIANEYPELTVMSLRAVDPISYK